MQLAEIIEHLRSCPLAACLSEDEIIQLIKAGNLKQIDKGGFVYREKEQSKEIFFLLKGVVKNTTHSADGREVIKMIQHSGSVLSEQSIIGEEVRMGNCVAMSGEVFILEVKTELIKSMMDNNHKLALCVINFIGKKLKNTEERLESLLMDDARERIVGFLKDNAENFGQTVGYELLLKHNFTQQDIANYTGTSRQTVTTVLNDLKKSNKIYFKRKAILIRDMARLF